MFVAVMQTIVVCAVWNSLMTAAVGSEPKDDGWVTSEVQRRKAAAIVVMAEAMLKNESLIKTRLLRKGQSSGSDTMLKILEDCIIFHNERIYISAFI